MLRGVTFLFGVLTCLTIGAQGMILLERADGALLSLGQLAALLYWPDPGYASRIINDVALGQSLAARAVSVPAVIGFGGPWALLLGLRAWRRQKRP